MIEATANRNSHLDIEPEKTEEIPYNLRPQDVSLSGMATDKEDLCGNCKGETLKNPNTQFNKDSKA